MRDEGITAEMIRESHVGWRRFLFYFKKLQRPETASRGTRDRWRREVKKLDEQLEELGEKRRALAEKLENSCPHLVDDQKVFAWRGEDTLGNFRGGESTEYTISCGCCGQRLATFTKRDEMQTDYEGKGRMPWEKK